MKTFVIVCSLVTISVATYGQAQTSGAVTFAELEGAVVNVSVVRQQIVQREGQEFPVRLENDLKLVIGHGEAFDVTTTSTAHTPRGVRKGKSETRSLTLQQPGETKVSDGGGMAWTFNDGALITMRTLKGGVFKREIAFIRNTGGLACTATETMTREAGAPSISVKSPIDGSPIAVKSSKQISSSCQVTMRK